MALTPPISATLGEVNASLAIAGTTIPALSAQVDAMLSSAVGPYQADLNTQFNASLAAQATLSVQIGNPIDAIQQALAALAQLQAQLQLALALPTMDVSLQTELATSLTISGALEAKLGAIQAVLEVALSIKTQAVDFAGDLAGQLSAGPVFAFAFSGSSLATAGGDIQGAFSSGLSDPPNTIAPGDNVSGIVIVTKDPTAAAALSAIFSVT